uniref:TMV resistance protein N n=1 Tax=Vitis vinifera TaxID=29760 RepID=F6GYR0_VITVI
MVTFFTPTTSTALHDLTASPQLNLTCPLLNLHCYYYSSLASRSLLATTTSLLAHPCMCLTGGRSEANYIEDITHLLEKLNTIRLSCSQHLIEIPDISISAPNLEKLIFDGCSSLLEVHPSIGKLNKLILLNLKNCKKLVCFPCIINMKALQILNFSGCSGLKKFPNIQGNMENLLDLYLASIAIEELPSSIGHLTGLVLLDLKWCKNLKSLPTSICKLKSLEYLFLSGCSKLESFPEMMENMDNLKELLLDGTPIEVLPSSIERLKVLILLNLRKCKNLVSLSKKPPSVDISRIGIPEWIWHQNAGSSIKIELPTDWYNDDFLGFAFFSVLEHLPERIICRLNSDVFYYGDLKDFGHDFHWKGNIVGSEHVWLGYQPCSQLRLFQFNDPNDWNRIEISFEAAQRFISSASNVVKKCGICFIYAEDLEGIHLQNRKQLKRGGCNVVERSSDREGLNGGGT